VTRDLDELTLEPTIWDLAVAIGLEPDESERPALEELGDAMLVHAAEDVLDVLTPPAVDGLWSSELEQSIRDGLGELVARDDEWTRPARQALASFQRDGPRAEITAEVVRRLAWHLSAGDLPPFHCLGCLEEAVAAAPRGRRRELALQVALIGLRDAAFAAEEVVEALGRRDPSALATDERRRAVRRRLARLAHFAGGGGSLPALAAELASLAEEPLPPNPKEDDVWQTIAITALNAAAQPELN
jgi:hypothetical protein